MSAYVCIAKVVQITPGAYPAVPGVVIVDIRTVRDEGPVMSYSRISLPLTSFQLMTGHSPVVGSVYKIVTSPGVWT